MTSKIQALNSIQKSSINRSDSQSYVNGGVTERVVYTCPTGYTATVKSYQSKQGAFGGGTLMNFKAKGQIIRRVTVANDAQMVEMAGNGIQLVAGETLSFVGDAAANNEDGAWSYALQELPA